MRGDEIAAIDNRPKLFDGKSAVVPVVDLSQVGHGCHQSTRDRTITLPGLTVTTGAKPLVELGPAEVLEPKRAWLALSES